MSVVSGASSPVASNPAPFAQATAAAASVPRPVPSDSDGGHGDSQPAAPVTHGRKLNVLA